MAGDAASAQAQERSIREYSTAQQGQQTASVLTALGQLGRILASIPGRKNLLWISDTFPVALFPEGHSDTASFSFKGKDLSQASSETVILLTASRVALHPVSARGLMIDHTVDADTGNGDIGRSSHQESSEIRANMAAMDQLATNTGGRALYKSNDLTDVITRELRNAAQYYTVAYTPRNSKTTADFAESK